MDPQVGGPTSPRRTASRVSSSTGPPGQRAHDGHRSSHPSSAARPPAAGHAPRPRSSRHQRDHLGVVARLDRLVGVRVARRLGGAALGVPRRRSRRAAGTAPRSTVGATRVQLQVGQRGRSRRWISAVPLACSPMPMPDPASRAAVRPIRPRSTVSLTRTTRPTQPSSSSPASSSRQHLADGQAGQGRARRSRPTAGRDPDHHLARVVARAGRPAHARAAAAAERRLLGAQVLDPERCWRMASISRCRCGVGLVAGARARRSRWGR